MFLTLSASLYPTLATFLLAGSFAVSTGSFAPAAVLHPLSTAGQPGMMDDHPARASLLAEHTAFVPGTTTRIGIFMEMQPEWYTYWDGQNDSGFAAEVVLDLPEGFTAGEILWPAPKRKISPGDILDHVYEREVLLMIPITVAADVPARQRATISAQVDWLVCREACIPGGAKVSVTLPVETAGAPLQAGRRAELFTRTTQRLPRPLPELNSPISYTRNGDLLSLVAPGASKIAFYPANDCAPLENPLRNAQADGPGLDLSLSRPEQSTRIVGVVEVWTRPAESGTGQPLSQAWWFDTDPPAPPAGEKPAQPGAAPAASE